MNKPLPRRSFLKTCGFSLAGIGMLKSRGTAVEPFKRPGAPRLPLSLAAYSLRDSFVTNERPNKPQGKRIDLFQFIDFCAEHGCQGTELTSYYFPKDLTDEYLLKLRRHAFLRGIAISGTAVGNNFALPPGPKREEQMALVKKWIEHAGVMGAPHIRIFAGAPQGISQDEAKRHCISAVEECADYAGKRGVFLGLENHGGIVAEPQDLLDLVRAIKSPWVGINLDTGNFHTDDPYRDLALCAPYALNVQVKSEISRRGQKKEPADLAKLIQLLRDVNYQGYVALEYEAADDPWQAIPGLLKKLKELCA